MSEKRIEYQRNTVITVLVKTSGKVRIRSQHKNIFIQGQFPVEKNGEAARLWGKWLVECRGSEISLYENTGNEADDILEITFIEKEGDIRVAAMGSNYDFTGVSKIEAASTRAAIFTKEPGRERPPGREKKTEPRGREEPGRKGQDAAGAAGPVFELQAELKVKEDAISALTEDNSRLLEQNQKLEQLLRSRLDELLGQWDTCRARFLTEIKGRLEALEKARREEQKLQERMEETEKEIHKVKDNIGRLGKNEEDLKEELERLRGIEEALTISREEWNVRRDQIHGLIRRAELDQETISLLEDGTFLKKNSVAETMETIVSGIDAAEKRIELILHIRENIDDKIQTSILSGDGTITAADESGGKDNGNRSAAAAQDTGTAGGY